MRKFRVVDPGPDNEPVISIITEEELRKTYYPYWCERMRAVGKANAISFENCLEDWITVQWAQELTDGEA